MVSNGDIEKDEDEKMAVEQEPGNNSNQCYNCKKQFRGTNRWRDLARHLKSAVERYCKHPGCERRFCNENDLQCHIRTEHPITSDAPAQSLDSEVCPETGHSSQQGYRDVVERHLSEIITKARHYSTYHRLNYQIEPSFTYADMQEKMYSARKLAGGSFKFNIGFGVILYHGVENEYRYFYSSTNSLLFERALLISNNDELEAVIKRIIDLDLLESYYLQRPSSGWTLAGLPNVELCIYPMKNVLYGTGEVILPDHVKNSKSIRALTHCKGVAYTDHKCFWRALAIHLNPGVNRFERLANQYMEEFEKYTGNSFQKGISLKMLGLAEIYFGININVHTLQENNKADIVRLSKLTSRSTMNLNLCVEHFSLITNLNAYARKYKCGDCDLVVKNHVI